ncbi:hypothetical protein BDZ97DRAFT_1866315 [Flammula alnicola]|nr:hypothetical protein BDZ97DRAFT_1866315 [Flammula alnicola]
MRPPRLYPLPEPFHSRRRLIFVEFAVRRKGKDEDDEPLGAYSTPLGCLEQGFRHLSFYDVQLTQHLFSTIFIQVNIRDVV